MRRLTTLSAALLMAALPLRLYASPASAVGETCDGRSATIVVHGMPGEHRHFQGTDGDDVIYVEAPWSNVTVDGLAGNDTMCVVSSTAKAILDGGPGDDTLDASQARAGRLTGGEGDDTLLGSEHIDELDGGVGNDVVEAGKGRDVIREDASEGAPGDDVTSGGAGSDTYFVPDNHSVTVDLAHHVFRGFGHDVVTSVENWVGSTRNDVLIGNSHPNELVGNGGKDRVVGNAGDDSVSALAGRVDGDSGNDFVGFGPSVVAHAGRGRDQLITNPIVGRPASGALGLADGGPGLDSLNLDGTYVAQHGRVLRVDVPRRAVSYRGVRVLRIASLEAYTGNTGLRNVFRGGPADETYLGGEYDDDLRGGGGHDSVNGSAGYDLCRAEVRSFCEH